MTEGTIDGNEIVWAAFDNVKADRKIIRWLTKSGLNREKNIRPNLTDEEKEKFAKILDDETEENMSGKWGLDIW